jgi:hypothetical protein
MARIEGQRGPCRASSGGARRGREFRGATNVVGADLAAENGVGLGHFGGRRRTKLETAG